MQQLPPLELIEYTHTKHRAVLEQWWENENVVKFVGPLDKQLTDMQEKTETDPERGRRIHRPTLRWLAEDLNTSRLVGYVSVQVSGQGGSEGKASPVTPPFHGGVNIVVDPDAEPNGYGTAIVRALFRVPALADVETLGGAVDVTNTASLGMLRKLGVTEYTERKRSDGKVFRDFVFPRPCTQ